MSPVRELWWGFFLVLSKSCDEGNSLYQAAYLRSRSHRPHFWAKQQSTQAVDGNWRAVSWFHTRISCSVPSTCWSHKCWIKYVSYVFNPMAVSRAVYSVPVSWSKISIVDGSPGKIRLPLTPALISPSRHWHHGIRRAKQLSLLWEMPRGTRLSGKICLYTSVLKHTLKWCLQTMSLPSSR